MNSARILLTCCLGAWCLGFDGGCSSCQAPYDYSGPTVGPDGKPIGGFGTRVGSAWAGTTPSQPRPTAPTVASRAKADEGPAGQPTPGDASSGGPDAQNSDTQTPDAAAAYSASPYSAAPAAQSSEQPAMLDGDR